MCTCIETVDADLAGRGLNTRVETPLFGPARALVRTLKADDHKRQKPAVLFATCCPFCGERYPEEG